MVERIYINKNMAEIRTLPVQKKDHSEHFSFIDNSRNSVMQHGMKKLMDIYPRQMQGLQLKAISGSGNLEGTVNHVTVMNNGVLSALEMHAQNIRLKPLKNALADEHAPSIDIPGWTQLQALGRTASAPYYVRMHLLNGQLGGKGDEIENLAPGSSDLNHAHYTEIEKDLHDAVLARKTINSYDVFCTYRSAGLARFNLAQKNAYKHTLKEIQCQYVLSDGTDVSKSIQEDNATAAAWP